MSTVEWIGTGIVLAAAWWWLWQLRHVSATVCGHQTQVRGLLRSFDEVRSLRVPLNRGQAAYCIDCLGKMTIRCAWCGHSIFVGDPITLYAAGEEGPGRIARSDATAYREDEQDEYGRYIGCLRMGCAETSADRSGFWLPPGRVHRVPTAWELSGTDVA